MIIATAGHIDHGKTALVRALTGVDTDRLPQEKARGISIDLGFAYWRLPTGGLLGFVDVPGHERFVRNMLAGVCGIDFAMLVVAADDGVMPQTREHLNIIDLLGIRKGLVVLTKIDRVEPSQRAAVRNQVAQLIAESSLSCASIVAVSSVTGEGIDALRDALQRAAADCRRDKVAGRRARHAIDRVFSVPGSGTVATGTVFDGRIDVGDHLMMSPGGKKVRIRGIQVDGAKATHVEAGERCALNLVGVEVAEVQRGDWVLDERLQAPVEFVDVRLRVLPGEAHALRHWTPVHLHLGTCEAMARVSLRRSAAIEAGTSSFARLLIDRPIAALHGDRFIVRDASAQRTLGGGIVLDAFPAARRLPAALRDARLAAFEAGSSFQALAVLAALSSTGVDAASFARNFNLDDEALTACVSRADLRVVGRGRRRRVVTPAMAEALQTKPVQTVWRESTEQARLWPQVEAQLRAAGRSGASVSTLARALRSEKPVLMELLHARRRRGEVIGVETERFYLQATFDEFADVAQALSDESTDGRFKTAAFRDHAGIGRTLSVKVLEAMDRMGLTRRLGDVRIVRDGGWIAARITNNLETSAHD